MIRLLGGLNLAMWAVIALALSMAPEIKSVSAQAAKPAPVTAIEALLEAQSAAWNRGNIDEFMTGYWNSEATTFAGSNGVSRGWEALRERYHRNYADRATMGTLVFSKLEVTELAPDAALVLGHWRIERPSGPVGGVFTLVLKKFPEGWRIIHDHTSAAP
jgi:ketosteroid isomerase-like protein